MAVYCFPRKFKKYTQKYSEYFPLLGVSYFMAFSQTPWSKNYILNKTTIVIIFRDWIDSNN